MKKTFYGLIALASCAIAFLIGNKLGYDDGMRHNYGIECKEDLEKLKSIVVDQNKALENIKITVQAYTKAKDSIAKAEQQKKTESIKKTYNGIITVFDEKGQPIIEEERLKEVSGLK